MTPEEEMLVAMIQEHSGAFYLFAVMTALLIVSVLIAILTTEEPAEAEGEPLTPVAPAYLARVPDDVRRMQVLRGGRRLITLELLAVCTWEVCAKIREEVRRIRR
jgi:hypothetical protein